MARCTPACYVTLTGYRTSHCSGCHETFGGVGGFDLHQKDRPDGRGVICAGPATLGLERSERGVWVRPAPKVAGTATPLPGSVAL